MSIGRRTLAITPVAAVVAALGRPRRPRGPIRDAMYAELLGAFKAIREDFREYRRMHP